MKGKLFVIESGTDASGKATQTLKLYERLVAEGYNIRKVEYPNYKSDSSTLIKMYLNGEFGKDPEDVNSYAASTFFAVDRYASFHREWKEYYEKGGMIIADRYTTSNMVHQASKIQCTKKRSEYLNWLWDLEFSKFGLPIPNKVIFLDMPIEISSKLMEGRKNKYSGTIQKDIHESSIGYLKTTYENACWIAEKYGWERISCTNQDGIKSIEDIHGEVYGHIINEIKSRD